MGKMAALWVLQQVYNDKAVLVKSSFTPELFVRESARAINQQESTEPFSG
jgi:LacI family transcriptional regulator